MKGPGSSDLCIPPFDTDTVCRESKETALEPLSKKGMVSFGDHGGLREEGFKFAKELSTKTSF